MDKVYTNPYLMLLRQWNTVEEQSRLEDLLQLSYLLLLFYDDSSVSSLETSSIASQDSDLSNGSTVNDILHATFLYGCYLYSPLWDDSIVWGRQLQIMDVAGATCIDKF